MGPGGEESCVDAAILVRNHKTPANDSKAELKEISVDYRVHIQTGTLLIQLTILRSVLHILSGAVNRPRMTVAIH